MWSAASLSYGWLMGVSVAHVVLACALGKFGNFDAILGEAFWNILPFVLVRARQLHDTIHVCLLSLYTRRSELHAAAGVAGLIGDRGVREALAEAKQRFRCVSGSRFVFEVFAHNTPGLQLAGVAEAVKLGECDAFLSHSWHDQPEAKWQALQSWRSGFVQSR